MTDNHHSQARSALHDPLLCNFVRSNKPGHLVGGLEVVGEEVGEAGGAGLLQQAEGNVSRKVADKMKILHGRFRRIKFCH